jgi:glucose-1-phosphate thymidylyltransferase
MIERGGEFAPFVIDEWFDCGKPEAMLETNRKVLKNAPSARPIEGSIIIPPVSISPGAEIVNSIIGPYVSIAERAVVHSSVIRDSVLAEGATVTDALLESSLIGTNAVIRGGFKKLDVGDSSEISFK